MAGQKGRDVLVKIGDGGAPETFLTLAGVRTKTFRFAADGVDATSWDSAEGRRELLAGAGVRSLDVTGSGVFKDAASDARLRAAYFAGETVSLRLIAPDFGEFSGPFHIAELTYGGDHDGEAVFTVRLSSAGVIQFAEAAP